MTSDDLQATIAQLRALLDKATPQNIDTAEDKEDGYFVCPHCEGDGYVDGKLYVNYGGVAANVHFSGIGREHKDAEELFRALIAAAPALLDAADRISALEAERAWRPIETAPMGAELMVWCPSDAGLPPKVACFSQSLEWLDEEGRVLHPTHWLPLPQPPGDGQ